MGKFMLNGFGFLFAVSIFASTIIANSNIHDAEKEYWQKRREEARELVKRAYEPDVFNVTNRLNQEVHSALMDLKLNTSSSQLLASNKTRRFLRGNYGPCMITNPIDRCWRCQANWHLNRKNLADCGLGFGYKTSGGKAGKIYIVTDNTDNSQTPQPGTLRWGVVQRVPLWIIFDKNMNIRLEQELIIQSDKTIDGRGVQVNIIGGSGLTLQFVNNVIIHGIHIRNIVPGSGGHVINAPGQLAYRTRSDGDGISIFGSSNIWIDHVSMAKCTDGIIDVIEGSTAITISNSHFTDHNEVMLFGAHDNATQDKIMQITVAFNHFGERLVQRMPRCRYGFIHVVNNDYTHWMMYAIGGSSNPTIISQGNRFTAPLDINAKEVTKREYATKSEWQNWTWMTDRDLMMNGAFFVPSGDKSGPGKLLSQFGPKAAIPAVHGSEVHKITQFAGALNCRLGVPC